MRHAQLRAQAAPQLCSSLFQEENRARQRGCSRRNQAPCPLTSHHTQCPLAPRHAQAARQRSSSLFQEKNGTSKDRFVVLLRTLHLFRPRALWSGRSRSCRNAEPSEGRMSSARHLRRMPDKQARSRRKHGRLLTCAVSACASAPPAICCKSWKSLGHRSDVLTNEIESFTTRCFRST